MLHGFKLEGKAPRGRPGVATSSRMVADAEIFSIPQLAGRSPLQRLLYPPGGIKLSPTQLLEA